MERINERRKARGREELRNVAYQGREPKSRAEAEQPKPMEDEEEEMSLTERQAERTKAFREKFKPTTSLRPRTSLASNKAIRDEEFNRRFGRGPKGISTPTTQGAMNRIMGTV